MTANLAASVHQRLLNHARSAERPFNEVLQYWLVRSGRRSLGGRPAHYTWWPRHLIENTLRQPLHASDITHGTLVLTEEALMAMWPNFFSGRSENKESVLLHLEAGPVLETSISHLVPMRAVWGVDSDATLAAWLVDQGARSKDNLIVRVLDPDRRHYALSLKCTGDRAAVAVRNQALANTAEQVLRAGRGLMPSIDLIPRMIARDVYRAPIPPDPLTSVLSADLRFVLVHNAADLVDRIVASRDGIG